MRLIPASTPTRTDIGLAILRIVTGVIFTAHGAQKLFTYGFAGVTGAFAKMGAPMPAFTGPATALVEFFGGLALIVGLLTRLAGFGLAVTMVGAIVLVHLAAGFFGPSGYEFPLALLGATVALAFTGAGRFSLDALITGRTTGVAERGTTSLRKAA
jgi:putative oxidoreductase